MTVNYIDALALDIFHRAEGDGNPTAKEAPLYRMYALLARSKGTETTPEDVHDAWSAWCAEDRPNHPSLIPFDQLTVAVQLMDDTYVKAIHAIAKEISQ